MYERILAEIRSLRENGKLTFQQALYSLIAIMRGSELEEHPSWEPLRDLVWDLEDFCFSEEDVDLYTEIFRLSDQKILSFFPDIAKKT